MEKSQNIGTKSTFMPKNKVQRFQNKCGCNKTLVYLLNVIVQNNYVTPMESLKYCIYRYMLVS